MILVGEAWGAEEEAQGRAFVGASGRLLRAHLSAAGLSPILTNLVNRRPPKNEFDWFRRPENEHLLKEGLEALRALITSARPSLVIGVGAEPLRYLTDVDPPSITQWRGSHLWLKDFPDIPFLPTVHPAAVLRNYEWSFLLKKDLERASLFLKGRIGWEPPIYDFGVGDLPFLESLDPSLPLAIDLETHAGQPTLIGLSQHPRRARSFPFPCPLPIWLKLREIISTFPRLVGHNFLYDATYLRRFFAVEPKCWLDTMVAHHLLYPGLQKDLGFLASLYCPHFIQWKMKRHDSTSYIAYNCEDAARTFEIAQVLEEELKREGLWKLYEEERRPTWELAASMTWRGILFDEARRESFLRETLALLERKEGLARRIWDNDGWWRSSLQVRHLFYDILGLAPVVHKKTGRPTVSKASYGDLRKRAPNWLAPTVDFILQLLEEIRSLQVFISSFLEKTTDFDGRIRCFFDIAGTETFRLSSSRHPFGSGGNLQNIPTGTED